MTLTQPAENTQETLLLQKFKAENPELFRKDDTALAIHLFCVAGLLLFFTVCAVSSTWLPAKIVSGVISGFLWFCFINTTIHHHQTHRNAAAGPFMKKVLDVIFFIAVPNAPKRKTRYTRAHLNHHLRPFHETDVDHHYGTERYLRMMKNPFEKIVYYLELTFVGAHMPGWEDDRYMNEVPLETWCQAGYAEVKKIERKRALQEAALQWGGLLAALAAAEIWPAARPVLHLIAWGWAFPMLLVKNWSHFLGQFQHYKAEFLDEKKSMNQRTKSFHVPSWLNYLTAGELSGHFLHHLYPEMPYYHVEQARARFAADPELARTFLIY